MRNTVLSLSVLAVDLWRHDVCVKQLLLNCVLERDPSGGHNDEGLRWAGGTVTNHKEWLHCGRQPVAAQLSGRGAGGSRTWQLFWWPGWEGGGQSLLLCSSRWRSSHPSWILWPLHPAGPSLSASTDSLIHFLKLCTLTSSRYWGECKLLIRLIYIFVVDLEVWIPNEWGFCERIW